MTDRFRLVDGGPLPYLVSAPEPEAEPGPHLAVLCFLHGYDEAAPLDPRRGLTRHGPLSATRHRLAAERFLVVAPQLPRGGDLWDRHADAVRGIVMEAAAEHGGDPARFCLTGFSFGGNGVFDLASLQPGVWSALWAVDPTRVPREDPGLPVWLSIGEVSRRAKERFIEALRLRPAGKNAPEERVFRDAGLDHVDTASEAYADGEIYRWMLARPPAD